MCKDKKTLTCKHGFHKECITKVYQTSVLSNSLASCPICRKTFRMRLPLDICTHAMPETSIVPVIPVLSDDSIANEKHDLVMHPFKKGSTSNIVGNGGTVCNIVVQPLRDGGINISVNSNINITIRNTI